MQKAILNSLIALFLLVAPQTVFARYIGHFERDLKVSGTNDLQVQSGSGNITVRTGSDNTIHISARIQSSAWFRDNEDRVKQIEANPPVSQAGTLVKVGFITDPDLREGISIDYEITAPASTRLEAHSGSGNIDVRGLQNSVAANTGSGNVTIFDIRGDVRAGSGSGNIRCERVGAPLTAHTGSGNVDAYLNGAGDVDVQTGSGNLHLEGANGGLRARAGSGELRIGGNPRGSWMLRTGSGDVKLNLPSQASYDLDAHAGSGEIRVSQSVQGTNNRHNVQGRVGNGGPKVSIQTGSGDIEID